MDYLMVLVHNQNQMLSRGHT